MTTELSLEYPRIVDNFSTFQREVWESKDKLALTYSAEFLHEMRRSHANPANFHRDWYEVLMRPFGVYKTAFTCFQMVTHAKPIYQENAEVVEYESD